MGQIVEYGGIEEKLKAIQLDGEQTKSNLENIDKLIQSSVGEGGGAWSGESASQFRASWDELAAELPTFIQKVELQATNVQNLLSQTKAADQNGAVNAPGTSSLAGTNVNVVQ